MPYLVAMNKSLEDENEKKYRGKFRIHTNFANIGKQRKPIPTEVLIGLMPKTKNDIEVLMKDIRENKDGELYSGLEKYKGEIFKRYFETTL